MSVDSPFAEDWTHVVEKERNMIPAQNTKKQAVMRETLAAVGTVAKFRPETMNLCLSSSQ